MAPILVIGDLSFQAPQEQSKGLKNLEFSPQRM